MVLFSPPFLVIASFYSRIELTEKRDSKWDSKDDTAQPKGRLERIMARKAEDTQFFPEDINLIAGICRNAESAGPGLSMKSENPTADGVWFRLHHEMTRKSYGEKITITLSTENDLTKVHILSQVGMPTQLTDGGMNKQNVELLFGFISYQLNQLHAAGAAEQKTAVSEEQITDAVNSALQKAADGAGDPAFKYCPNCGEKQAVAASFCNKCGQAL